MYSLDINFLNDRPDYKPPPPPKVDITSKGPVFLMAGAAVGVAIPALVGGMWFVINTQNEKLTAEKTELESRSGALEAQVKKVDQIKAQTQQYETQSQFFGSIFDTSVKPLSALMEELGSRLPAGMQITAINHTLEKAKPEELQPDSPWSAVKQKMEIEGVARSFDEVNQFVLTLKKSPFLKAEETELVSATLVENPIKIEPLEDQKVPDNLELPKVVQYKINTIASNVRGSEILKDLERAGDLGVVSRIKILQQQGVIKQ